MTYIGVSPSNGVRRVHTYTATGSQTTFTGASSEGITLSYTDANFMDVYQNGVLLAPADYTATSGTSVVLAEGAAASDIVTITVYDAFSVADTVSKSAGGTFDGNVTMAGTLGVTGVLTGTSLDISGNIDVDGTTNLDVVDIDGAVDMASTLGVTGVVTANAGVVVDNITIDGTQIDLSSGDLTLDVAGDIILDAGGAEVKFADDGTQYGTISNSSTNLVIKSDVSDKDIIFQGNDGGSVITALTLDMSDGGRAAFAHNADFVDGRGTRFGAGNDLQIYHDGSNSYINDTGTGSLIIEGANVQIQDTQQDLLAKFNNAGAVQLYHVDSGTSNVKLATSGTGVTVTGNIAIANGNGIDFGATANSSGSMATELLDDYEEGTWTPTIFGGTTAGTYSLESARTGGKYTKIGRLVTIVAVLRISSIDSAGAGTLNFGGLPFAFGANIASSWGMGQGIQVTHYAAGTNSSADSMPPPFIAVGAVGASTFELYSYGKNYQVASNIQTLSATSWIYQIAGTYMTS